uniref:Transthyretin-like family-containing protein n=1 Tax=Parastrongyloides trichosuri TaxID=131310 RepID=A0A0N4ZHC1_PARTI
MYKIILFILLLVNTSLCRVILSSDCNGKSSTVGFQGTFKCNGQLHTPYRITLVTRSEAGVEDETIGKNIQPTSLGQYDFKTTFIAPSNFYLTITVEHRCNILQHRSGIPYVFSIPIPNNYIYCNGNSGSSYNFGTKELNGGYYRPRASHMGPFGK